MQAGDVLCIHSHVIHQGQDNQTDNSLRLSVDLRFQIKRPLFLPCYRICSTSAGKKYKKWPETMNYVIIGNDIVELICR